MPASYFRKSQVTTSEPAPRLPWGRSWARPGLGSWRRAGGRRGRVGGVRGWAIGLWAGRPDFIPELRRAVEAGGAASERVRVSTIDL